MLSIADRPVALTPAAARGLLLTLGLVVFGATVYPRDGWLLDDALIYQNYVRNAASGNGLVYGPFGPPVEGYSSPLWATMLTAIAWLGGSGMLAAKALGTVLGGLTVALIAILPVSTKPLWLRASSVALIAAQPSLAWWAASGLETPLLGLLVTSMLAAMMTHASWGVAISAGLLAIARPEGPIFTLVGLGWLLWHDRQLKTSSVVRSARWVLLGAPALLWQLYRLRLYGAWLANSALAKIGPDPYLVSDIAFGESLAYIGKSFVHLAGPWMAFIVAAIFAWKGRRSLEPSAARVACFAIVGAGLIFTLVVRADWMPFSRFIVPLAPSMVLALELCWRGWSARIAAGAAVVGFVLTIRESRLDFSPRHAERSGRWLLASYSPGRKPFRDPVPTDFGGYFYPFYLSRYTVAGDRVLIPDIGQAGYLAGDVEILDQFGLVSLVERRYIAGRVDEREMLGHLSNPLPAIAFVIVRAATGVSALKVPKPLWPTLERDYTVVDRRFWWSDAWNMLVFVRKDASHREADPARFRAWLDRAPGVAYDADKIVGTR